MILTCPHCGSQFRIDPTLLGERGRRVRCSGCGERWLATPAAVDADRRAPAPLPVEAEAPRRSLVQPQSDEPAPPDEPDEPPPEDVILASGLPMEGAAADSPRAGRRSVVVGWLVVVLVLLLLAGTIVARDQIANSLPVTAGFFEQLGLPVTVRSGLEFRNLASDRSEANGIVTMVVEGDIHNHATTARNLPAVRVGLLDEARNEVDFTLHDLPQRLLPAGGTMHFQVRLVDPPSNARTFSVNFDRAP